MAQLMLTIYFQYYESKFVSYILNVLIIESCLGVRYICFQITDMGLSTTIDSKEQIQKKVVQLVLHNVVKGGWWKVALHNKQKNIACLMHKVGRL
jgi:hypothetical protein